MYRIYDRPAAIRRVQDYLREAGNKSIFVAPTGIYDDNTRLSVIDFQKSNGFEATGIVNRETFDKLFLDYSIITDRERVRHGLDSFISFPILPGVQTGAMMHINRTLRRLLDYYGHTHSLRDGNIYTAETEAAVRRMRDIYRLKNEGYIDEEFYVMMIRDHDSVGDFNNNFGLP